MRGDGHCFYYAVLGESNYIEQMRLRNCVASFIREHQMEYNEFLPYVDGTGLDEYLELISQGRVWADHIEIDSLMRFLDRPIVIIDDSENIINANQIYNRDDGIHFTGSPIFVYYNGSDHYDALIVSDESDAHEIFNNLISDPAVSYSPI